MLCTSHTQTQGRWTVIRVSGTAGDRLMPALRVQLAQAVAVHPRVAVDLSGCRLTGTRWMSILLEAAHLAPEHGHLFAVVSPRPHADRLCLPVLARGGRLLLCESTDQLAGLEHAGRR
ncbi:STAS domain-containing protein [Nonomuraea sp. NPDC050404]|uniref:STAS domain-containing protein n=1 Tax=Nonomuraea sp. NPDC050404 TaxID=3155783 RepID=UPI0033DDEA22